MRGLICNSNTIKSGLESVSKQKFAMHEVQINSPILYLIALCGFKKIIV